MSSKTMRIINVNIINLILMWSLLTARRVIASAISETDKDDIKL